MRPNVVAQAVSVSTLASASRSKPDMEAQRYAAAMEKPVELLSCTASTLSAWVKRLVGPMPSSM